MKIARYLAIAAFSAAVTLSWGVTAKLCLDPGHGGSDPGAVGCGQQEATNVLNTYLKFRNWLNADTNDGAGGGSWTVVMTRTTNVYVSLQGRCDISNNNGANKFICVHNNACGCGATGTETFCVPNATATTQDLRNKFQYRTLNAFGLANRGNKVANFYVLVYTNAGAELCELGFIDNCGDAGYLGNATHQDNLGKNHLFAIQTHYGLAAYTPGAGGGATYTVDNANAGFTASANWATGSSSADKYGADYRFRPTEAISDAAQWSVGVSSGSYTVYAWWTVGTNRSTNVPYVLPSGTSIYVNQQANGGKWNTLATGQSLSGTVVTKLSCWAAAGQVAVADAVRYVR